MLEIVTEAKMAAGRSLERARRAACSSREGTGPDALARVIEGDIIPQLLVVHRNTLSGSASSRPGSGEIPADFAERFAAATLSEQADALMVQLEALMLGGVDVETIYLDLLAPAARQLGKWWDQDACDFVDVTMGLWRLQELVHALSALVPGTAVLPGAARCALFSPAPGEQHGLGALIVEEFFRRAGWQTWSAPALDEAELVALAGARSFDLVGLTVSVERHLAPLARSIAEVRRASRNPHLLIMVGGRVFTDRPELAVEVGADGTASDGQLAVQIAEDLMTAHARRMSLPGGIPPDA
jgi:methanogenic corrinoid protein MtbC1